MDIYTNPSKSTYVTGIAKLFMMPSDKGLIPAVVVSKRSANIIVSAYTILILLIFMVGWNLLMALILSFWPTRGSRNRQVALVALWNSGESVHAATMMLDYCLKMMFPNRKSNHNTSKSTSDPKKIEPAQNGAPTADGPDPIPTSHNVSDPEKGATTQTSQDPSQDAPSSRSNMWWGFLFFLLAAAMSLGTNAAGILVPSELLMGNVAPPQKDVIFYPDVPHYNVPDDNGAGRAKLTSLKAPAALRAIGAIESSDVTVRDRVFLERVVEPEGVDPTRFKTLKYSYNVTAVDMGLQTDPGLEFRVSGSCRTEYGWLVNHTDTEDIYKLWGEDSVTVHRRADLGIPPMVTFHIRQKDVDELKTNMSYAMMVNTAGRYSYTSGQDPWYATKKTDNGVQIAYTILGERPALSCWEASSWHLGGHVEESDISALPGLQLDKIWAKAVFPFEFWGPRVSSLGLAAGTSALKSASFAAAPAYVLDAGLSSIFDDLERLVLASWVSSRNVLIDTTTYKSAGLVNVAKGQKGSVEASTAKFVLQSGDVGTLSVRVLISIPAVLLFLLIVDWVFGCVIKRRDLTQSPIFEDMDEVDGVEGKHATNATALQATQIFRRWDQKQGSQFPWGHLTTAIPVQHIPTEKKTKKETKKETKAPGNPGTGA
ncbi:hypothetical protein L873DRAFT_1803759 [Choiromyces venosus 120613-1]|uniref:Uncharacterized protein n=1 Tax=Choiromyces venosus 120613-1 TaxID=1336337 RepID=A0A3N4JSF3_9PEZI|nr:hypothetical protein L873DRAFT_1803759 [Choiromyces venosus 120613-1]